LGRPLHLSRLSLSALEHGKTPVFPRVTTLMTGHTRLGQYATRGDETRNAPLGALTPADIEGD
jgi:hypothetical protein